MAKGAKHLTRAEVGQRREREVKAPVAKTARAPGWLPEPLRRRFHALAKALIDLGLYSSLDGDTLGRYVVAHEQWLRATDKVQGLLQSPAPDVAEVSQWARIQTGFFQQARACATDLGLTISSRCRLVLPESGQRQEANPFEQLLEARRHA